MDAVIFDVDGTLWDARIPVAHAWRHSLEKHTGRRYDLTLRSVSHFFGRTMDDIAAELLPEHPPQERQRLAETIFREENEWLESEPGTLYPGVPETLEALQARYPLFIVSNCQQGYVEVMLRATGLGPLFTGHLCYGDTRTGKGRTLVALCERWGLTDPVYVGDTQGDADACAEAGIPMIWAAYGLGVVASPWRTIHTFPGLLDLL